MNYVEKDRFRDLQYPGLEDKYCNKHPNFPITAYGGRCAYCRVDLPTLIHEGFQLETPMKLDIAAVLYLNISNLIPILGLVYSVLVFLNYGDPTATLFVVFVFWVIYKVFKAISMGIYNLSLASLYIMIIIPTIHFIILLFTMMSTLSFEIGHLHIAIILLFSFPPYLILSDKMSRKLFNMSANNRYKFKERHSFVPAPEESSEKFKLLLKRNIFLIILVLTAITYFILFPAVLRI